MTSYIACIALHDDVQHTQQGYNQHTDAEVQDIEMLDVDADADREMQSEREVRRIIDSKHYLSSKNHLISPRHRSDQRGK